MVDIKTSQLPHEGTAPMTATILAEAGTEPGDAFVGREAGGAIRLGYRCGPIVNLAVGDAIGEKLAADIAADAALDIEAAVEAALIARHERKKAAA